MSFRLLPVLLLAPALALAHGGADVAALADVAPSVPVEPTPPPDGETRIGAGDAHAHGGADAHHAHGALAMASDGAMLPEGAPWPADEPLSRGMARVRTATLALEHAAHVPLEPAQVRDIAAELRSATQMMFAECRLAPAPDAALHPLLATVLEAAGRLEHGFDAGALASLQAVLARYPRLFDDAAWSASQSD